MDNNNQRPKNYVPQFANNQNNSGTPRRPAPTGQRPSSTDVYSDSSAKYDSYRTAGTRRVTESAQRQSASPQQSAPQGARRPAPSRNPDAQGMQFEDVSSSKPDVAADVDEYEQPEKKSLFNRPSKAERAAKAAKKQKTAADDRKAAKEERKAAKEERKAAAAEERRIAAEERKVAAEKPPVYSENQKSAPKSNEEKLPPVPKGKSIGDDPDRNKFENFIWYNHLQRTRNIFAFLTVFCVLIVMAVGFVSAKLDLIDTNTESSKTISDLDEYGETEEIYEDETFEEAPAVTDATSYTDFSYKWATNGAKLRSSKNVINVLLVGLDSDDALENGGRSDSMILASLNKKEKKIYLTSFYRDTWTYMNTGGVETYTKMNAAYMYGQDAGIVSTLENNFKINIDYYVTVDFSSFTDIINKLGGITVKVEQYEAEYINSTSVHNIEYGDAVTLDGWEALVFARIRKSDGDSDVSRTRRQRIVISAFIDSVKDANLSQINDILNELFSYVRTDLSKMEILSYAVQALANGWADYDIESVLLNDDSIYRTGYVGNSSVVFVDFPAVSELVQKTIYGDSAVIASESQNPFDFMYTRSDGEWGLSS